MATRDETLRLQFEVEGISNLKDLRTQIDALGDQGKASAAELSQLTDALANTSALQQSLARLRELGQQYVGLQQSLRGAQAATVALDAASKASAANQASLRAAIAQQEQGLLRLAEAAKRGEISEEQRQRASVEARTEIQKLTAELREAEVSQRKYDAELEKSRGTASKLAAQQEKLRKPIAEIRGELQQAGVSTKSYAAAQAELQSRAAASSTALQRLAGTVSQQVQGNRAAAVSAKQLADANEALGRRGFGDIRAEIERVRAAYETLRRSGTLSTQELSQAQSRLIERTRELRGEYGSLGGSLRQVQGSLIAAGASLFTATRLLSDAARTSQEFGTAIAEVSTLLDDTSGIAALSDSVKALARDFGGPASAQARALYQIISAGATDSADANRILAQSNRLAIAGVSDLKVAADGITSVLNAYGKTAADAESVSDSLFAAVRAGKTTVDELAGSIGQVAPIAATAGVEFDELAATIATLTQGGVATTQAVTQIRAVLAGVVKPTKDATKAAEELGIEFNLAALRSQGLAGFLQNISERAGDNEEALSRLFGSVEGLQAVFSLVGQQAGNFERNLASVANAAGATQAAFEKIDDTPAQRLARFSASVDQLKISFGDAVSSLAPVLDGLAGLLNIFNELPGSVRTGAAGIVALSAVVAPLAIAIVQSRAALVLLLGSLRAIGPAAAGAGAGVGVFSTAATGATAAAGRLSGSLAVLSRAFAVLGAATVGLEIGSALNEPLTRYRLSVDEAAKSTIRFAVDVDAIGRAGSEAAAQFSNFGSVAIKTAAEVQQLGESQREAYREALDGLNAFLRGRAEELIAQQRSTELTAEQRKELDSLFVRLDAVRKGYVDLDSAALGAAQSIAEINSSANSAQVTKLADEIRRAAREGKGLSDAISGAFDGVDFENEAGKLGRIALAFEEAGRTAGDAGRQIREGIAKEIQGLSGRELLRFQQAAQFAFDQVGKSGSSAAAALNQTFEQAVRRLGVSFEAAGIKISEEGGNIIATFQTLAQSGLANAATIQQGFTSALAKVSTSGEVEALKQALDSVAAQGIISAQQYDAALQQVQARLREIAQQAQGLPTPTPPPPAVAAGYKAIAKETQGAADAAGDLGKQTQQSASTGTTAIGAFIEALKGVQAEFADLSSNNDRALEQFNNRFERSEFLAFKVQDAFIALERTSAQLREELAANQALTERLAGGLDRVAEATDAAGVAASGLGGAFAIGLSASAEEIDRLLSEIDAVRRGAETAREDLQLLDDASLDRLQQSAERAADRIKGIGDAALQASQQLAELERRLQDEADRAAGNEQAVRQRELEDQLREIDELAAAGTAADQERAARLRRLAEEAFQRDIELIRAREREQANSDDRTRQRQSSNSGSGGGGSAELAQPSNGRDARQPVRDTRNAAPAQPPIQFNFNGPTLGTPEELTRTLAREFEKLQRTGFNPRR